MSKENIRLNIEISKELQTKIKNFSLKNNLTIKDFLTNLIEEKINNNQIIKPQNDYNSFFKNDKIKNNNNNFKVAILCGGPSLERGISLNSARSVLDNLEDENIEIIPFFIDQNKNPYLISKSQLYSNTPSDFDFKIKKTSKFLNDYEFINELKKVDMVFPLIHGIYGEDGEIQKILEENNIPFIGSGSIASKNAFNKDISSKIMSENGFYTYPSVSINEINKENEDKIKRFFDLNKLKKAVVKPIYGGSSIGVHCIYSYNEAIEKTKLLFDKKQNPIIIEPFCLGKEFTIIVLQNQNTQKPIALIPTEIEMIYENYQIFDYRRKYLPTQQTRYHNPARFENETIQKIRNYAEEIFTLFDLKDIVRIDGWLLNDGRIWFSDINITSGMEQNSFVFQQSSRVGLSHRELLKYILNNACIRQKINKPISSQNDNNKKSVNVLFGGSNAERQVSLMSGTNVWLKLKKSKYFTPNPYLLDFNNNVWYLPYMYNLSHTVEEIYENCINAEKNLDKLLYFSKLISNELEIKNFQLKIPIKYSFQEFLELTKNEDSFLFLALHGGKGEDGTIQKELDKYKIKYNGSNSEISKLCMNKNETGKKVNELNNKNILSIPKIKFSLKDFENWTMDQYKNFWIETTKKLYSNNFIIKPNADGSSSGVVRIYDYDELKMYIDLLNSKMSYIPKDTFKNQSSIIEIPSNTTQDFLLESFIETDKISINNEKLEYNKKNGWLELTVGVIEKNGNYHSFNPSITIAENNILTIEEKFQGGTGINLTPPPIEIISKEQNEIIKSYIETIAKHFKIKGYSRIDIFFNTINNKMLVIEFNTLPALTPSTVIFHQALNENPTLYPLDFIELLIDLKSK